MADRRICSELKELRKNYTDACSLVELVNENIYEWKATLIGPPDSPYENGRFELSIKILDGYPFRPPKVEFLTPIFHPNISNEGKICLDILGSKWSAAYTVPKLVVAIRSLLSNPNTSLGINDEAAKLRVLNNEAFKDRARQMTEQYAKGKVGTETRSDEDCCIS